ncbi:hypothetical protein BOW53_11010 [Solemya pervernicosa gill symbiont]|uniref:DUF4124 domain-containing protein n=2 Tax=Gammaproteobacteria incertae sedis TaxID=118884 RepID=A0A1T2L370_9GAMM|nr:DUF4124 domain-containing protein [Candidatus Reidiella endopervernicosa]OOZ39568.1 hypothetical protein BOW53_11010 [Solemya pervernicosa gill symbiont]QKQ25658.1 DUF4124 domain-containing protein [Candidatus Reidiella endopervernicosa]
MMRSMLLIAALIDSMSVSAEMHRWTDADGNIHYSDRPKDEIPEQVVGREDRLKAETAARAAKQRRKAADEARQLARIEREFQARNNVASSATLASCDEARQVLHTYKTAGLLYTDATDGGFRVMRLKERQDLVKELSHDIKTYCSS